MNLPTELDYPLVAIGDLHGRADWLRTLLAAVEAHPDASTARVVFLGDFVDRHPQVRETLDLVLGVLRDRPGSTAVTGNHDLALSRALGLGGKPYSPHWRRRYQSDYDHVPTFESYLARGPDPGDFDAACEALKDAMPPEHADFLGNLPWGASAAGHLFLHCGLSKELGMTAQAQWGCVERKLWDRATVSPKLGTTTERWFDPEYPSWVGASRKSSLDPLPYPGKVQVSGHVYTREPDANGVRIRIDTTGGSNPPLCGCLLRDAKSPPEFLFGSETRR